MDVSGSVYRESVRETPTGEERFPVKVFEVVGDGSSRHFV
jgi:hypothetical protein